MKTALLTAALGAAIALVFVIKPAQAAGYLYAEAGSGTYPSNLLSDDACGGDSRCDKSKEPEASAGDKNVDGDGLAPGTINLPPADAESTDKPVSQDSPPPPAAGSGVAIAKADDDEGEGEGKGKGKGKKDEDEEDEEEEDDEWDDGPYEDPLGFDDE